MTHLNRLDIDVPPGAPEGFEVVLDGEADESPDWEAGDIVVRVRSKPSVGEAGGWRRKDSGLYRREIVSVDEVRGARVDEMFADSSIGTSWI